MCLGTLDHSLSLQFSLFRSQHHLSHSFSVCFSDFEFFYFSEQLSKFTGIAAVLRFPFEDVDEEEEDDLSFLDEDEKGKEPANE